MEQQFEQIPGYDLQIANFGAGANRRIIIIRSSQSHTNDQWHKIEPANILVIGQHALDELRRYISSSAQQRIREAFPGKLSGTTHQRIREYFNLVK
jgi:hypothetical protein